MWETPGLNLATHDGLMDILVKGYQDIHLAQKNRPEGMGLFFLDDFTKKPSEPPWFSRYPRSGLPGRYEPFCRERVAIRAPSAKFGTTVFPAKSGI